MAKYIAALCLATAATSASAVAQQQRPQSQHPQAQHAPPARVAPAPNRPRANGGHLPPAPVRRAPATRPEPEHVTGGYTNTVPHVSHNRWYGHQAPLAAQYHLARPFPAGHFAHVGTSYRYGVTRVDAGLHRIWFPSGYYFDIAAWEWPLAADWCWDCGDDFVVYPDDDHPGWYLVYNMNTGTYVHAQYMGE